jgi:hypothetical protein
MQLCCVFLLLFAQQAALMHAVSHVSYGAAGHVSSTATTPAGHGHDSGAAGLCAFDAAFNQVLGGAAGGCAGGDFSAGLHELRTFAVASVVVSPFLAPLSRGPPVLL